MMERTRYGRTNPAGHGGANRLPVAAPVQTHKISAREAERRERQRYVDTHEAAAFLGLSESYLNKARHFGTGPDYVRYNRMIRYDLDALEAWAKAHSVSARDAGSE